MRNLSQILREAVFHLRDSLKRNPGDFQSESQVIEKVQEFQGVSLTPIHISSTGFSSIKPDSPSKTVNLLSATFAG